MEEELIKRIEESIASAEEEYGRGSYGGVFLNYLEALNIIASCMLYRELGVLYPPEQAMSFLETRHPELHRVIVRYQKYALSISSVSREVVEEMRGEVMKFYNQLKP